MTNFDDMKAAAAQTAAVADDTDRLPTLGWRNGVKQARTPGFFYIKADDLGGDVPSAPWVEANIYDDEEGYKAEQLHLVCLGYRTQAYTEEKAPGQKYPTQTWLTHWEPGARIRTEALVIAEGLPGLWVWSSKGMTGKALTGKGGILPQQKKFTTAAGVAIGAQFSPWAFWMLIGGLTDVKGGPIYTDTGHSSLVTLPGWLTFDDTNDSTADLAQKIFVGKDNYAEYTRLHLQYKASGWFDAKRGNAPAVVIDDAMSRGEARGAAYEAGQADWSDSPDDDNRAPF